VVSLPGDCGYEGSTLHGGDRLPQRSRVWLEGRLTGAAGLFARAIDAVTK